MSSVSTVATLGDIAADGIVSQPDAARRHVQPAAGSVSPCASPADGAGGVETGGVLTIAAHAALGLIITEGIVNQVEAASSHVQATAAGGPGGLAFKAHGLVGLHRHGVQLQRSRTKDRTAIRRDSRSLH